MEKLSNIVFLVFFSLLFIGAVVGAVFFDAPHQWFSAIISGAMVAIISHDMIKDKDKE